MAYQIENINEETEILFIKNLIKVSELKSVVIETKEFNSTFELTEALISKPEDMVIEINPSK